MRIGSRGALALVTAAAVVAAGCAGTGGTAAPGASAPGASGPARTGLPYTATLKDGSTFTLNPRIVEKLDTGGPINYVFSYGSTSIPLFSPQYKAGYDRSIPEAQKILPTLTGTAIAPASALQDANEQIAQIQALWDADQID